MRSKTQAMEYLPQLPGYLSIAEIAAEMEKSTVTAWFLVRTGQIPAYRIANAIVVRQSDWQRYKRMRERVADAVEQEMAPVREQYRPEAGA